MVPQVSIPRDLVSAVRRLDRYDLRQLLVLVRGLLLHVDGKPREERDGATLARVTYRQEQVSCGKTSCRSCPHGPYWYAYWKEGGRTRSCYVGRHLPGEPLEPVEPDRPSG